MTSSMFPMLATLGLLTGVVAGVPGTPRAEPAPTDPYYYFVYAISVDRPELALQQFADDAVVIAGPGCPRVSPCVGKAAIGARYLPALRAGQSPLPLSDQRFDGTRLRTRGDTVEAVSPVGERLRLRATHLLVLRAGKIATLTFDWDLSDPQTVTYVAGLSPR